MKAAFLPLALLIAGSAVVPANAQMMMGGGTRDGAVKQAATRFSEMDGDKDGVVTAADVTTFLARRAEETGRPVSPERAQSMFGNMDLDKDGKVTAQEAGYAAGARFDAMDTNKNGKIDDDERPQRREGGN